MIFIEDLSAIETAINFYETRFRITSLPPQTIIREEAKEDYIGSLAQQTVKPFLIENQEDIDATPEE